MHEAKRFWGRSGARSKKRLEAGETKTWHYLAIRLKKTLQEVQKKTSSSEFTRWKVYFADEPNDFNVLYCYLAQIACEIARGNSKKPKKIRIQDKILKFEGKAKPEQEVSAEEKMKRSKAMWFAAVGLKQAVE